MLFLENNSANGICTNVRNKIELQAEKFISIVIWLVLHPKRSAIVRLQLKIFAWLISNASKKKIFEWKYRITVTNRAHHHWEYKGLCMEWSVTRSQLPIPPPRTLLYSFRIWLYIYKASEYSNIIDIQWMKHESN